MGVLVTDHWTHSFDLLPWRMIWCGLQARGALLTYQGPDDDLDGGGSYVRQEADDLAQRISLN